MTGPLDATRIGIAIIAIGLSLRVAFAVVNANWLHLPHIDDFHETAALLVAGEIQPFDISLVYPHFLGLVYALTGPHVIVGYVASTLAWTGAALCLDAILKLLGIAPRARLAALFVFALTPSSIFFGAVIMRDVYQLLFVNLMLLSVLRIGIARDYDAAVPMVLSGAGVCLTHWAFPAWTIIVVLTAALWVLLAHRPRVPSQALVVLLAIAFTVFATAMLLRFGFDLSGGIAAATGDYRELLELRDPRTAYRLFTDFVAAGGLLSIMAGLLQYMFEPMPWHAQNLGDLAVLGENVVRLVLLGMALWALVTDRARRIPILVLLFAWCCLEGIWSLGTIAWGSAVRHHLPGSGLLVAAAFATFRFERVPTPFRSPA